MPVNGGTIEKSHLAAYVAAAAALFTPLFLFGGAGAFDFWWWMSANIAALCAMAFAFDRAYPSLLAADARAGVPKKLALGLVSALALLVVFYAGNELSRLMFPFAAKDIGSIYQLKGSASLPRIALLMVLVIGPGEELIWRGFIQRHLESHLGGPKGLVLATALYAAVHVATGNVMLVLAALVCGAFWGLCYMRYRSMVLNCVSHVVWDVLAFLVVPFS